MKNMLIFVEKCSFFADFLQFSFKLLILFNLYQANYNAVYE